MTHDEFFTHLLYNTGHEWQDFRLIDISNGAHAVLAAHPDVTDLAVLTAHLFTLLTNS